MKLRLNGTESAEEIMLAYRAAGYNVSDDGYFWEEDRDGFVVSGAWRKIPELVEMGYFAEQLEMSLA